jgi:hypothetical protein
MCQKIPFTVVPGKRLDRVVRITMNPHYGIPMLIEKTANSEPLSSVGKFVKWRH